MYTEKEAGKKSCPLLLKVEQDYLRRCEGSKCMAWRWDKTPDSRMEGDDMTYVKVGYCGLAGRP